MATGWNLSVYGVVAVSYADVERIGRLLFPVERFGHVNFAVTSRLHSKLVAGIAICQTREIRIAEQKQ